MITQNSPESAAPNNEDSKAITQKLGRAHQENILILKYGANIGDELTGLAGANHLFEALIVDVTLCGFVFPAELLVEAVSLLDSLIELKGVLMFLRTDSAMAVVREPHGLPPSIRIFNSFAELFDFSPSLNKFIKANLGKGIGFDESGADLAQQILMGAVPVLTEQGFALKCNIETSSNAVCLLSKIDNYSPVAALVQRCKDRLSESEVFDTLRHLEEKALIFPIFPKIPFLTKSFKNKQAFSLEEYLIGCKVLSQSQLDELILERQGTNVRERMTIGAMAVKKNKISSRLLEIALADQAFYGQPDDVGRTKTKVSTATAATGDEEAKVQSLVGHLGSTDPMSLLQNMATNRETGVLSVEFRDMQFKAHFEQGKPVHARIGKVHGNNAILEFASSWNQGIFVFIKRPPSEDLVKDTCKVTKPLDKLLLDAALAQDNMQVVWKKLPRGPESVLEKDESQKSKLEGDPLVDLSNPIEKKPVSKAKMEFVKTVWNALDGLTPLSRTIRLLGDVTTPEFSWAIGMLLDHQLVTVPEGDISGPMGKFQRLVLGIREHIGNERNSAFLRLSFRDTLGYSGRARVFLLSHKGEVGVDMAAARSAGTSLSTVIADLENWQVKYIEYVSQDLDRAMLLSIIREVHEEG